MLKHLNFDNLSSLEIGYAFDIHPNINQRHERTQALIKLIHNAPLLEKLVLRYAAVDISDLENLHKEGTKLKHLEFDHVQMYDNDVENQRFYYSTDNLETFSVKHVAFSILGTTVQERILYIGSKYPQLKNLDLQLNHTLQVEEAEEIRRSLEIALRNLKHLKSYSDDLCYLSGPTLDVMTENDVQLDHFGFLLGADEPIEEIVASIKTARPASTISSPALGCNDSSIDVFILGQSLFDTCVHLKYLTRLDFNCCYADKAPVLLIDILQNLTMLESLELRK